MKKTLFVVICFLSIDVFYSQKLDLFSVKNYPSITYSKFGDFQTCVLIDSLNIYFLNELELKIVSGVDKVTTVSLNDLLDQTLRRLISKAHQFDYYKKDQILCVKNYDNLFLFKVLNDQVTFSKHFTLIADNTRNLYLNDSLLFCYEIYNHHPSDSDVHASYNVLNINSGKQSSFKLDFKYLSLTHLGPSKFIDFNHNVYVLCDPFQYKFLFYDYNNQLIDSLQAPGGEFTVANNFAEFNKSFPHEKVALGPVDYFKDMNLFLSKIDRVWTVNFIDHETIFVTLTRNSLPSKEQGKQLFYQHTWKKINGTWKLITVNDLNKVNSNGSQLKAKTDVLPYFFLGSKILFNDGLIYYLFWGSGNNEIPQSVERFYGFNEKDRAKLFLKRITFGVK